MKYELVKFVNNNLELEVSVSPDEDTVWLTKEAISTLFNRDRTVISRHIKNLFIDGELDEKRVSAKNAHTGPDGKTYLVDFYNLDVVIAVGYRVKSPNATIFRKWAANVLKEYLLKGYVVNGNRVLVTNENYINLINKVERIDNRLSNLENENLFFPKRMIVYENKLFDAISKISDIISRANERIVLIDPYIDTRTLDILKDKKENVVALVFTSDKNKLSQTLYDSFNTQYGGLEVVINNTYHDRYLIIDDIIFYHLGSSINYLGNKFTQIDKIVDDDMKELLRKRINEQK